MSSVSMKLVRTMSNRAVVSCGLLNDAGVVSVPVIAHRCRRIDLSGGNHRLALCSCDVQTNEKALTEVGA